MSETSFGRSVRAAARRLWYDPGAVIDFTDTLYSAITRGYEQAWQEGASSCGMLPEDRTPEEQKVLMGEIASDQGFMLGFASYIIDAKNLDKKWGDIQARIAIWENRYPAVVALAQQTSCGDQKYKWRIGQTEKHCVDCLAYNGRVYRASTWAVVGARPQSSNLACHGFHCDCHLDPTNEPAWKGRPPAPSGGD